MEYQKMEHITLIVKSKLKLEYESQVYVVIVMRT